jgi:ribonuclease P protein component
MPPLAPRRRLPKRLPSRRRLRNKAGILFSRSLPPIFGGRLLFLHKWCIAGESSADAGKQVLAISAIKVSSFSFPKTRRLTHHSEYERVKRNGVTQRGKLMILNVMPTENSSPWRAGFVTSSRLGGAVVRNRIRRRLREIVRRRQHSLRQGFWFVVIARQDAASVRYAALEDEWLRLARRASILL